MRTEVRGRFIGRPAVIGVGGRGGGVKEQQFGGLGVGSVEPPSLASFDSKFHFYGKGLINLDTVFTLNIHTLTLYFYLSSTNPFYYQ